MTRNDTERRAAAAHGEEADTAGTRGMARVAMDMLAHAGEAFGLYMMAPEAPEHLCAIHDRRTGAGTGMGDGIARLRAQTRMPGDRNAERPKPGRGRGAN